MSDYLCLNKLFLFLLSVFCISSCTQEQNRVLVFSKTMGMRHTSIEPGILALQKMGLENGFSVDTTEDASFFTEDILQQYATVVFLNTTGDVLNDAQQADFERYIQAGGGYATLSDGQAVEFEVGQGQKGPCANKVKPL